MPDPKSPKAVLYSRDEKPFGVSWEEWTIRWWKWLLSIPIDINPGIDPSGEKFSANQHYSNVLFLAGTFEGYAERTYSVPSDRAIFFPAINFITSFVEEPNLKTDSDLVRRADEDIQSLTNVKATVDGITLQNICKYRVQSPVFELRYEDRNVFSFPPCSTKAISDGFWIFLKGFNPGQHDIHVTGSCYSGATQESTTWHLEVT